VILWRLLSTVFHFAHLALVLIGVVVLLVLFVGIPIAAVAAHSATSDLLAAQNLYLRSWAAIVAAILAGVLACGALYVAAYVAGRISDGMFVLGSYVDGRRPAPRATVERLVELESKIDELSVRISPELAEKLREMKRGAPK